jgi:hypothetical protein
VLRIVLWTIGMFFVVALVIGAFGGLLGTPEVIVLGFLSAALAVVIVRRRRNAA